MTDCLWTDIDAYLSAAITSDMGVGSSYTSQKIATVVVGDELDFDAPTTTYPVALVTGVECTSEDDTHSGGPNANRHTYPYILSAVAQTTTLALAKATAQELGRRLRVMLNSTARHALGGLTATDGEHVTQVMVGRTEVVTRGPAKGKYVGIVGVECTLLTEV
jgi:hypothetical protein